MKSTWVNAMKSALQITNATPFKLKSLILLLAIFTLAACGSQNESTTDSSQSGDNVSFQIPDSILANRLDQAAGTLTATLAVDGVDQETVTITGGATTVSFATLKNIPTGSTEFSILFTYNLDPYGALDVAFATQTINVTEGGNSINFVDIDFDTASFDEDGDGISNIMELDEFSTSNPVAALCKLGTAVLGSCELGS